MQSSKVGRHEKDNLQRGQLEIDWRCNNNQKQPETLYNQLIEFILSDACSPCARSQVVQVSTDTFGICCNWRRGRFALIGWIKSVQQCPPSDP